MDHLAIFNEVIQAEYKENGGCVVNIRLRRSLFRSFTFWIGMGRGAPRGMRADGSRLSCRRVSCRAVRFARWWAARRLSPRLMRMRQGSQWQAPLSAAYGFNVWCVMLSFPVFDFFSISMDKVSLRLSPIVVQYRKNIRKKYLTSSKCFSLSAAVLSAITYICWNVKQRKDK